MKPPPPRRALRSAGLGGHARVGPGKFLRSATQKATTPGYFRKKSQGALAWTTAGATIAGPAQDSKRKRLGGDFLGGERERGVWRKPNPPLARLVILRVRACYELG